MSLERRGGGKAVTLYRSVFSTGASAARGIINRTRVSRANTWDFNGVGEGGGSGQWPGKN